MSHAAHIEAVRAALGIHPDLLPNADAGRWRRRRQPAAPHAAAAAAGSILSTLLQHWWYSQSLPALAGEAALMHALFGSRGSMMGRRLRGVANALRWIFMLGLPILASTIFTPLAVGIVMWLVWRNLGSILGLCTRLVASAFAAVTAHGPERQQQPQRRGEAPPRRREAEEEPERSPKARPVGETLAAAASAVAARAAAAGDHILHGGAGGSGDARAERLRALTECPISNTTMRHPVTTCDGYTYDRENIERWFALGNCTSPMTGLVLPTLELTPNRAVESLIAELHAAQ